MNNLTRLTLTYALFAAVATAANIGAQNIIVHVYRGAFAVPGSVLIGTGVGLVVKYVLDKRYIFGFTARSALHDGRTFSLYVVMGLATTVIFWGFEFGFDRVFGTEIMRYVGGMIGLAIGYVVKYNLDRRFVFRSEPA